MDTSNDSIIFLNNPIESEKFDIIGVSAHVNSLVCAIEGNAQMIAVTSPFGTGKSSLIELLERKLCYNTEQPSSKNVFIKLPMWSQIKCDENNGNTIELHKTLMSQFASQINNKKGTYINRKLSSNFGLFKIHLKKSWYSVLFWFAIILFILTWGFNTFPELFSLTENSLNMLKVGAALMGFICMAIFLSMSELLFSLGKKVDVKREISLEEIFELYRSEILEYKKIEIFQRKSCRYIVVLEDLDRTEDANSVINFLKELRKYYIPNKNFKFKNDVIFIVNIKPEELIKVEKVNEAECKVKDEEVSEAERKVKDEEVSEAERKNNDKISEAERKDNNKTQKKSFYAKVFDFTLDLQTINIDNYDSILDGLLEEKREQISKLKFAEKISMDNNKLSELPGMKWIIRERGLGIREIKERLNIAFSTYISLSNKFPDSDIKFEKCTAMAYLRTAFEKEFFQTDDRAFQNLVNKALQQSLTDEDCGIHLAKTDKEYQKTVNELINSKLIESDYRTYFYNYPKGSYLYNSDESQVSNAILYGEHNDLLEEIAKRVVSSRSIVLDRSFKTLSQLGLPLPATIFDSETLYIEALSKSYDDILKYLESIIVKDNGTMFIAFFEKVLSYDKKREFFNKQKAEGYCKVIIEHCEVTTLMQLRSRLCKSFKYEIMFYESLFSEDLPIIKLEEIESLSLKDVIALTKMENKDFSIKIVELIESKFEELRNFSYEEVLTMQNFLENSIDYVELKEIIPIYLAFMETSSKIIPSLEKEVVTAILNEVADEELDSERKNTLLSKYKELINKTSNHITEQTLKHIAQLGSYDGYNFEISDKMKENGYIKEYILLLLFQEEAIPFEKEDIKITIENNMEWFIMNINILYKIRAEISNLPEDILKKYTFMFEENCPILTENELNNVQKNITESELLIMSLTKVNLITPENHMYFIDYFNRRKQNNNTSFDILKYISTCDSAVVKDMFYSLNFDNIKYQQLSSKRRSEIKEAYKINLNLDLTAEKLKFMKSTKFIDTAWENSMIIELKENKELQESYIEVVNLCSKLTKQTIEVITGLGSNYILSLFAETKLLEFGKYNYYVSSKVRREKLFEIERGNHKDELWQAYINIFSSEGYKNTRKIICENKEFLKIIMENKLYINLPEENRMQLYSIYQNEASIEHAISYGSEFAINYYSSIAGFIDKNAATAFVEIVKNDIELLASDNVYINTHNKLGNSGLKTRYTKARKAAGYSKPKK